MKEGMNEISMLQETLEIFRKGYYVKNGKTVRLKLSKEEVEEIRVFLPDDVKNYAESKAFYTEFMMGSRCAHGCENKDSFTLAGERLKNSGFSRDSAGILVLNMADPEHPGGSVREGTGAQEEDLCRKSSLLFSLESKKAEKYYDYNKSLHTCMGSDALMITPKVEIIRDENGELLDETVTVSVLTCAAPRISSGMEGMSKEEYEELFYNRIMGMLKCAAYF
ncbi:MAG: TIGR02452 family protein, partial [Parasporobacterium sp.]|nr:TIGR02452 family protein [Parasporobacterium sp.]